MVGWGKQEMEGWWVEDGGGGEGGGGGGGGEGGGGGGIGRAHVGAVGVTDQQAWL